MHSTFSDGRDTIEDNIAEAEALGLTAAQLRRPRARRHRLGPRATSTRSGGCAAETAVELRCGIEAKLLDTTGALDLPTDIDGVDAIYAADHQVPLADGPNHPREVRERIEGGDLTAEEVDRRDPDLDGAGPRPPAARRDRALPQHPAEDRA